MFTCFGHAVVDSGNGCCLFVVSFQVSRLIRLKINAFLVSFPFMIKKLIRLKFNPFGWVHMMDSSILILIRLKINAFLVSFPFMIKKIN